MAAVELVTVLALLQYFFFGLAVGQARGKYGIKAPAITGDPIFERVYRVQMNTLEVLIIFLPALWMAAHHMNSTYVALIGAVYIIGRFIYWRSYVNDPSTRSLGFALSMLPTLILVVITAVGLVREAIR